MSRPDSPKFLGTLMPTASIRELATQFHDVIANSGAFSCIAVVDGTNSVSIPGVEVYLSERQIPRRNRKATNGLVKAIEIFDELALSLEPNVITTLHLVREQDMSADQLQRTLKELTAPPSHRQLLHEETF